MGFHKAPFQGLCGLPWNGMLPQLLVKDNMEVLKIFQSLDVPQLVPVKQKEEEVTVYRYQRRLLKSDQPPF